MMTSKEKLKQLEELNIETCDNIAVYQNICVDELCEQYASILVRTEDIDKGNSLSLLSAFAKEIQEIYFG